MKLVDVGSIHPAVNYDKMEEVTFSIYSLYGLPHTSVMPFLR
jgi:hypothetical protein